MTGQLEQSPWIARVPGLHETATQLLGDRDRRLASAKRRARSLMRPSLGAKAVVRLGQLAGQTEPTLVPALLERTARRPCGHSRRPPSRADRST